MKKDKEKYYELHIGKILKWFAIVLLAIIIVGGLVVYYNIRNIKVINNANYMMKGEIIKENITNVTKVGISADTDKLDFGRAVFNATNSIKIIDIHNPTNRTIITFLLAEGNITELLNYSSIHLIKHHISKEIYVKMESKRVGNFSGEMRVFSLYPQTSFSEKIMLYLYNHNLLKYAFPEFYRD